MGQCTSCESQRSVPNSPQVEFLPPPSSQIRIIRLGASASTSSSTQDQELHNQRLGIQALETEVSPARVPD